LWTLPDVRKVVAAVMAGTLSAPGLATAGRSRMDVASESVHVYDDRCKAARAQPERYRIMRWFSDNTDRAIMKGFLMGLAGGAIITLLYFISG
jgi:hypothetical protein